MDAYAADDQPPTPTSPHAREHAPDASAAPTDATQALGSSTTAVYALVHNAVLERQQVIATYDGHRRGLCPHVLGTSHGRPQALFYQFGGTSRSEDILEPGTTDNWRCIPLDGLSDVTLRAGPWHTAANYAATQTCVDTIDVQVPDPHPPPSDTSTPT